MYDAKALGKNKFRFYSHSMNQNLLQIRGLEQELRQALVREEFVLHYQPKVEPPHRRRHRCRSAVALAASGRRSRATRSIHSVTEDIGLIVPAGEWVLRAACAQISAWQKQGIHAVPIAVNLSARQFQQPDTAMRRPARLRELGSSRASSSWRSPRSAAMQNAEATARTLHDLQDTRRPHRHRRLRHRLFVARLPEALPDRHAQDRPLVHQSACPATRTTHQLHTR